LPSITGTGTVTNTSVTVASTVPGEPSPPLKLDLRVTAGSDVRFFLPGVADIPVKGDVRVRGTLSAPTLSGALTADHGTIYVYGEKFELTSAVGTFSDDRGYLPFVELAGRKTVRGIKIYVNASGEIKEQGLLITFWSDPSMSQQEIIDILRLTSPLGADESVPSSARLLIGGLELVVDTVFGRISEDVRRWIDADNLALTLDEQSGVISLEVGKYVLDSLYVSYEQKLDDFSTKIWSFDLYLEPYLVLTGTFSTTSDPVWGFSYSYQF
jgi:autotransporter translocation and assembly factor TamB